MADIDSTATIENAIAHLPDDGGDVTESDLAPDTGSEPVADPDPEPAGDPEPVSAAPPATDAAVTPPAREKKIAKWVPGHRFQAQQEAKVAAEKAAADLQAKYEALEKERAEDLADAQAYRVVRDNPDATVAALLADERYGKLLTRRQAEAIVAEAAGEKGPAKPAAPVADEPPAFPEPDVQLADGSLTYRPETLQKYMRDVAAFERATGNKELRAEIEALKKELGDRVKPFEEQVQNERLAKDTMRARSTEFTELESVYGKEFVTEHKSAMLTWLRDQWGNKDASGRPTTPVKNAKAGLQQAQYAVLIPAMRAAAKKSRDEALAAADTAKARAIAEQNTRAAAAGERPTATGVSKAAGPREIEDVINAAIDRKGLAA